MNDDDRRNRGGDLQSQLGGDEESRGMSDIEELKARLLVIHDHDGNDLSPNDKRGLKDACAELDKLKRYEEREEHVRALFAAWDSRHGALRGLAEVGPIDNAVEAVRSFKLE